MAGLELARSLFEKLDQAVRVEPVTDPDYLSGRTRFPT